MNKRFFAIISFLAILLMSSCVVAHHDNLAKTDFLSNTTTRGSSAVTSETWSTLEETRITHTPIPLSGGPFLLIQTNFSEYQILDIGQQTAYPFDLPREDLHYRLADNLSPSGKQIILSVNDEKTLIMDIASGQTHASYEFQSESCHFQPEQAA